MLPLIIIIASLLACSSPLLTISYLWQLKEWRFDRLRVHLQESRTISPLLNTKRILIVGIGIIFIQMQLPAVAYGALALLLCLTMIQFIAHKQPLPIWTSKAKLFVLVACIINCALLISLLSSKALLAIALILVATQAAIALVSWLLLYPLDTFLKRRILTQASTLRDTLHNCQVIGVTGSVGKTTVKELLKAITDDSTTWVTPEHVNTEIGIARWLIAKMQSGKQRPTVLVIEMGAYRIGEIALMCRVFKPTIGIITKIGTQHIALFGSQTKLLQAKSELFVSIPKDGHVLTNGDDAMTLKTLSFAKATTHTIGTTQPNSTKLSQVQTQAAQVTFMLDNYPFTSQLIGAHNVVNIGLAIKTALLLNIPAATIAKRLTAVKPHKKTFTAEIIGTTLLLDDTHNTSPSSALSAVQWAKSQTKPTKIVFFSGFIEQGMYQKKSHEELGQACNGVFDQIFCTNKLAAKELQNTFKKTVTYINTAPIIPAESVVVCEGRIPSALLANIRSKIEAM